MVYKIKAYRISIMLIQSCPRVFNAYRIFSYWSNYAHGKIRINIILFVWATQPPHREPVVYYRHQRLCLEWLLKRAGKVRGPVYPRISSYTLMTWQGPIFHTRLISLELRRESRKLENDIEAKLNSFSKLSSNYLARDVGCVTMATSCPFNSVC